ncbi:hypothetical protein MRB53_036045 [Persea americana]|uniref:Uncharacterized protein n=1 Tax=Persea americana TaxID=3435 RepID=A0ACC2K6C3_PERAE|nr:hypothetical protein MRB53_036045 [Persea americana]
MSLHKASDLIGANDIDKLSDSLLISIINLLAIKDDVRTSTLSRRWRHLWKWIPSIDFGFDLQLQNKTYSSRDEHFYEQSRRLATIAEHASSRNLFENLQKLCINVELTDVSHVIALCYVLRHCVHIRVLQLEIEQYSAWTKVKDLQICHVLSSTAVQDGMQLIIFTMALRQ